jgi:hypothetical protein
MRSRLEYEHAMELIGQGLNDCQVERATGIPRRTVLHWRHHGRPGRYCSRRPACPICESGPLDAGAYAYLLGLYLGDGCIVRIRKTWCLRIYQDARYGGLIEHCAVAMRTVSGRSVSFGKKPGCVGIAASWNHWPCVFPQHGAGRKHRRKIELTEWQREIAGRHPEALLRGLIHSDGCRVLNFVNGKAYPRYHFANSSTDIQRIFTDACRAYGVSWTQPKWNDISVAKAADVTRLDATIGPKK